MFNSDIYSVNECGHLMMDGCDTVELAKTYGTPLYVMSENEIRRNCRVYKNAIDRFYNGNGLIYYASKAMCVKEMVRLVDSEGLGVDVVSGGELYTALAAGIHPNKICMHGNNKTVAELQMALDANVGRIVVESLPELELIDRLAKERHKCPNILVRITPGIDAHTHDFIMTGQNDSKFGVILENGEADAFFAKAVLFENIHISGVHCHIGSQIFELEPFREAARIMVDILGNVKKKYGYIMSEINLGGGFGVKYTDKDDPISFDQFIEAVSITVKEAAAKWGMPIPFIMMEPGRSIVGTAGITLHQIGGIKEIPDIRTYVSIDGGMGDNPRYILYQAEYDFVVANRANEEKTEIVTVAGKCCESGDLLGENVPLQKAEIGDYLATFTTGAYNYSMASNYNRIPRPPVLFVKDGEERLVVLRETYEDIMRNDI